MSQRLGSFSYEEQCNLKGKRPTPHLSLEYKEAKTLRKFQLSWYSKFNWLAGSVERNKLFCYICVLFRGENEWSINSIPNIKNLVRKAEKHQISKKHLTNKESFHMLGKNRIEHSISESRRLTAINHNKQVDINRKILARLIDVVCFLGKQELAFRGHHENEGSLNKRNYCEILDLLAKEEQFIREHFCINSVFKGTSHDIQNDLIHCVTTVLNSHILKELKITNFISIQADETTDVSCQSQMSLIFRYILDNKIEERFIGFFDVSKNKTAAGLSEVILNELSKWNIGKKVVYQTYDGASVMAGEKNGVQSIIQNIYPMVIFIHCYAHQLNLVLLHGAKSIKDVKLFIANLTMFHTFFSRSSKRSSLLREQGFKLPNQCNTRWNYHSRAALTIKTHFNELKNAVSHVVDDPGWDSNSVCTASDELQEVYQEVTKLIQLVLTIPATTASSERSMSTLKCIKSFLRNSMTNDRLSSLSTLAIEKKMLGELSKDPTFINNVGPIIQKQITTMRTAIPAAIKLQIKELRRINYLFDDIMSQLNSKSNNQTPSELPLNNGYIVTSSGKHEYPENVVPKKFVGLSVNFSSLENPKILEILVDMCCPMKHC
ncbi:zinc finger MYM-type protein 1-like [Sipha flava]|uniref:Zinc finger MYM-type protein 1-like n=1 Tax=Sipha flava TaxID=143950 RepID=A0A8B8GS54_9HEMI|nr:zinc finger MYM-type protein 1-like [Sipha flava]